MGQLLGIAKVLLAQLNGHLQVGVCENSHKT